MRNYNKESIRVSLRRRIYIFVSLYSFCDLLSTTYEYKPHILIFGYMTYRPKCSDHRIRSLFFFMYQLSPPLQHLLQINPISYFLHIPEIVPTISKVASNSFKDKISKRPHSLTHIFTQSQMKFIRLPRSFSGVNYYVMRSQHRGVSKIAKKVLFFWGRI